MTASMTRPERARRTRHTTPDSHDFPTRSYDLVKEFVIALVVVSLLTLLLAVVFSSPDDPPITLRKWAQAAPADVLATATAELDGTSASATYGPPYNHNGTGQALGPVSLQQWGGVRLPVQSTTLVTAPLRGIRGDAGLTRALGIWAAASRAQQVRWATAYGRYLTRVPRGVGAAGDAQFGPVPVLAESFLSLARSGALQGDLTSSGTFYGSDQTRTLLLLSDGAYLENLARAQDLGGDQWGMMNETGNYPGQPWLWLYTFWYQVPPFSTSANADAQVWALMMLLTLALMFLPLIPGLRSIPRLVPVHRLIWRQYYRAQRK